MADWVEISQVATAGGTLVLAIATFASIRTSNRSTRLAEQAMLNAQRPILITSRDDDLAELVRFGDGYIAKVGGHRATLNVEDDWIYLTISLRNGGSGLAVLHGWRVSLAPPPLTLSGHAPELESFRRQTRDLYIPAGQTGFWQGAIRDPDDPDHATIAAAAQAGERINVDLLYGDQEGGQRAIARFGISAELDGGEGGARAEVLRYWHIDRQDPR